MLRDETTAAAAGRDLILLFLFDLGVAFLLLHRLSLNLTLQSFNHLRRQLTVNVSGKRNAVTQIELHICYFFERIR